MKCQSVRKRKNCEKDKEKKCEESDGKTTDEKKRRLALGIKECIVMLGPKVDLKKTGNPNLELSSKSKKETRKRKRSIKKRQERQHCFNCKEKWSLPPPLLHFHRSPSASGFTRPTSGFRYFSRAKSGVLGCTHSGTAASFSPNQQQARENLVHNIFISHLSLYAMLRYISPLYLKSPQTKQQRKKRTWNDLATGPFTPSGLMYGEEGFIPPPRLGDFSVDLTKLVCRP